MDLAKLYHWFLSSTGICTDTRNILPGSLFVALKGSNFDGNRFVKQALEAGAAYALCETAQEEAFASRVFVVPDALKALQQLATHHREQLNIPVIAITGSNGKTTTKELLHRVLSTQFLTHCTHGNLNNHIGVPLTLLSLHKSHEMAVVEMGANHQHEIEELCAIAKPNYGIITNVGKAHLEGFGGFEGVIKGKSELYKYLRKNGGKLFVNADDPILLKISTHMDRMTYGLSESAHFGAQVISEEGNVVFAFRQPVQEKVQSHLSGRYNLSNMLAAACVGRYFRIDIGKIAQAISSYVPTNNRSQKMHKGKSTIWLDAYNANPSSMHAALENFAKSTIGRKRVVILGEMNELGEETFEEHQKLLELLKQLSLSPGFVIGKKFEGHTLPEGIRWVEDVTSLRKLFLPDENEEVEIFVKGSRTNRLEEWIQ